MLSRPLPTPVSSGTHTSRRATGLSLRHLPATRGASARRGATAQTVWQAFADWSPVRKQSSGGSPPNKPRQRNLTGGADQPEDPSATQGWWQVVLRWLRSVDGNTLALLALGLTILNWHKGLATTTDVEKTVKDSEDRMKERVEGVQKSVTESEGRTKERVEGVQKSVEGLRAETRDSQKWGVTWQHVGVAVVTAVFMKFFK